MAHRHPKDEACVDCLARHEAERLDVTQELVNASARRMRGAIRRAIAMLARPKPSAQTVERARDIIVRALLLELAGGARRLRGMVTRQVREKREVFGARSGARIKLPKMSKSEIKRRVEKHREVDAEKLEAPATPPVAQTVKGKLR